MRRGPVLLDRPLLLLRHLHLSDVHDAPRIPARPALAPWCRVVEDGDRLLVEHGGTLVTFEGRAVRALLPRLLPLVDGTRTPSEIGRELGPAATLAVDRALELLARRGLLTDGPPGDGDTPATAAASFAAAVTRQASQTEAHEALGTTQAVVLGSGAVAEETARALRRCGFGVVDLRPIDGATRPKALVVAAPDRPELGELDLLNSRRLEDGGAWLQLLPFDGRLLMVGPLFVPGVTGCRRCFVTRRGACSGFEEDFHLVEAAPPRAAAPAALVTAAAGLGAIVALRWATAHDPSLPGCFYALEVGTIVKLSHHRLLRVPRCSSCGPPALAVPSPWHQAPP